MKSGRNFLCCQVFPAGLPDSNNMIVELHNPSFVARQLGFSQAIPAPYSLDPNLQLCGASIGAFSDLEYFLVENDDKRSLYFPFDFENSSYPTPSFVSWWLDYYKSQRHRISVCKELLVANLPDITLQEWSASTKTKGTHIQEIIRFEKFFKVKYNPRAPLRVAREAMEVF